MSNRLSSRVLTAILASLVVALCLTSTARATVIAEWNFEPGSLTVDSANGHTLVNSGVTSSVDAAVGTGSALFNGSAIMNTVESLDLSSYTDITVSWWQKTSSATDGMVSELSTNAGAANYGAFFVYNPSPSNAAGEAMLRGSGTTGTPVYVDDYTSTASTDWVQMSVKFDLLASPSNVIQMYRGGAPVGTDTFMNCLPDKFANDFLFIGARSGGANAYTGLIDDLKIEGTVPEPGTVVLLATGLIGLLAYAWRKRK